MLLERSVSVLIMTVQRRHGKITTIIWEPSLNSYKGKGDALEQGKCRGLKLLEHESGLKDEAGQRKVNIDVVARIHVRTWHH